MEGSVRLGIAVAFALACCSCAGHSDSKGDASSAAPREAHQQTVVVLSALRRGSWPSSILFTGHWELVRNRTDGRIDRSSSRSFHVGDTMTLIFAGRRFCIYGIRGKSGGAGKILISGRLPQTIDFHAASKEVHSLVFDSGELPGRIQTATLSVIAPPDGRPHGYVNVEEVETR